MSTKSRYVNGILRFYESTTGEEVWPMAPVVYEEEFWGAKGGAAFPTTATAGIDWIKKIQGAAPPTVAMSAAANGTTLCSLTSTSEKQEATLTHADNTCFVLGQGCVFECGFKASTLPTLLTEFVFGLTGAYSDGPDNIANSAYFYMNGTGGGLISCRVNDNSTPIAASSGTTIDNTAFHTLRIDFTSLNKIRFYVDGAEVAAATTFAFTGNATAQTMQPFLGAYKASGAGLGVVALDFVRISQKRS